MIATATYQASVDGIRKHLDCSSSDALDVIGKAAAIARAARDEFWHVRHGVEGMFLGGVQNCQHYHKRTHSTVFVTPSLPPSQKSILKMLILTTPV